MKKLWKLPDSVSLMLRDWQFRVPHVGSWNGRLHAIPQAHVSLMISAIPEKHKFIVETMATDGDTLVSSLSVEKESPSAASALNDLFPYEVSGALKHSFPIFFSYHRENDRLQRNKR